MGTSSGRDHRLAFVVPTKDRREDLSKLLASFAAQSRPVDRIVIVDGGDEPVRDLADSFADLPIDYLRVRPPGFVRQKNAGTAALGSDVTLVGYVDDDIVLEPDAIEELMAFWETASDDTAGAQFHITNMVLEPATLFTRIFGTNDGRGGTILPSGFNVVLWPVPPRACEVEWLSGGATVWRRDIVEDVPHDEWFAGYGHMDDVDYSLAVGEGHRMFVLGTARAAHYEKPFAREKEYAFGVYDTVTRHHLVKKYPDRFSVPRYYWATLGKLLGRAARGVLRRDASSRLRARGYLRGLAKVLVGNESLSDTRLK